MKEKVIKLVAPILVTCFFFFGCHEDKKNIIDKPVVSNSVNDSAAKVMMKTFGLPYPDGLQIDSNKLLFYCARSYDTSSLVYLQKENKGIRGVFYVMLPDYHRFVADYADEKSNLLFFEGYSFIVDSTTWKLLTNQADSVLQYRDNLDIKHNYVDGSTYALYYNSQSRHGNSHDKIVYEGFDRFLKNNFLEKFIQAKKPIMHKVK